jgi:hypothetical protein
MMYPAGSHFEPVRGVPVKAIAAGPMALKLLPLVWILSSQYQKDHAIINLFRSASTSRLKDHAHKPLSRLNHRLQEVQGLPAKYCSRSPSVPAVDWVEHSAPMPDLEEYAPMDGQRAGADRAGSASKEQGDQ